MKKIIFLKYLFPLEKYFVQALAAERK